MINHRSMRSSHYSLLKSVSTATRRGQRSGRRPGSAAIRSSHTFLSREVIGKLGVHCSSAVAAAMATARSTAVIGETNEEL